MPPVEANASVGVLRYHSTVASIRLSQWRKISRSAATKIETPITATTLHATIKRRTQGSKILGGENTSNKAGTAVRYEAEEMSSRNPQPKPLRRSAAESPVVRA